MGAVVGASVGPEILTGSAEYNMLIDLDEDCVYHGVTLSLTAGLYPTMVEVHGEVGYAWVWGINLYDVAISITDILIGN